VYTHNYEFANVTYYNLHTLFVKYMSQESENKDEKKTSPIGDDGIPKYNKTIHHAVAPYFAQTYITLLSVVQGLVLGFLFQEFYKFIDNKICVSNKDFIQELISVFYTCGSGSNQGNLNFLLKFILLFSMIGLLWHRYVVHTQYLAWQLRAFDTLILMSFSLIQYLLVLSLQKSILTFAEFTTIFYLLGLRAYLHAHEKTEQPHIHSMYDEHFYDSPNNKSGDLSNCFVSEVRVFERKATIVMLVSIVYQIAFVLTLILQDNFDENIFTQIYFVITMLGLMYLFHYDLQHRLKNSKILDKFKIPF